MGYKFRGIISKRCKTNVSNTKCITFKVCVVSVALCIREPIEIFITTIMQSKLTPKGAEWWHLCRLYE